MTFRVKYSLYSALWVIVWLCISQTSGWAQTQPTSASLIQEIQQKYNVQIVGQLCTPAQTNNTSCSGDGVAFIDVDPTARVEQSVWRIKDQTSTGGVFSYSFATAGVQSVTLTRTYSQTVSGSNTPVTSTSAVSFTLLIGERPDPFQNWKSEHIICKGTSLTLNPYPSGAPTGPNSTSLTYLWFPDGRTTQTYSVTEGGCYSVEVFNAFGCSTQQRTQVELCPTQAGSPGSKWYFGSNAGLDFAGGSPTPLTDGKVNTLEGVASISNTKGQLLFYTDGITVFDKDGNPMRLFNPVSGSLTSASATLGGNQRSTQSALIVPKPICNGCDYEYYVYTTQEINGTRQLTYSIVDMRRNDGKGAVINQKVPVAPVSSTLTSTERSAAVMRDKDTTYWVITHDYGSSCFRINHLTASGPGLLPSTSACIGLPHDSPARGQGQMKIGPAPQPTSTTGTSGTPTAGNSNTAVRPMAVIVAGNPNDPDSTKRINYVELFTFNTETGQLSGPTKTLNLGPAPPTAYGVEFSPDGSKLFVTSLGDTATVGSNRGTQVGASTIVQYDLSEADPVSASALIYSSTLQQFGSLQVGPDGRIYVAVQGASSLGIIGNPNSTSVISNTANSPFSPVSFTLNGQDLGGKRSEFGLPNQVANFNEQSSSPGVSIDNACVGEELQAQYTPICPKIKNEFSLVIHDLKTGGVVSTYGNTTATTQKLNPLPPGSYSATVTNTATNTAAVGGPQVCTVVTSGATFSVTAYPDDINLGPDIDVCGGRGPIVLDMKVQASFYAWVKGNRIVGIGRTLSLDPTNPASAGRYIAYATNDINSDCFKLDDIRVNLRPVGALSVPPVAALCQGSSTTLAVPRTSGYQNFTWVNGSGTTVSSTSVLTASTPGTYTVIGSYFSNPPLNTITCVNSNTVNIVAARLPVVTPDLKQPTSCTFANGSISLSPAPTTVVVGGGTPTPGTSFTYSWSVVSGGTPVASTTGNAATALLEGVYRIRVTDENSCSVANDYTLLANVPRLTVTPRTANAFCGDPASGTAAMVITGGTPVGTGWQGPPGVPSSISVTSGTFATGLTPNLVYSFSATNDQGCVTSATVSIGVSLTTTLSVASRSKCTGDTVNLVPSRLGASDAGVVYRWNTGETKRILDPSTAGTYSVTALNQNNGCFGTASATVRFVAKPNVSAGSNQTSCLGGPSSASALTLSGASPGGGSWTALSGVTIAPQGSLTLLPNQIGQTITAFYSVTVDGCANSASKQITVRKNPQITAPPDAEFCQNSGTELQATSTDPGVLYVWSNGTQGSRIRPNQSGTYTVRATLDGCSATDDVIVTVRPAPVFALAREAYICVGDKQQALLRVVPQTNDQTVRWAIDGSTSTTLITGTVGSYSVAITGANGCTANAATAVIDRCEPRFLAPNAFTPNGDGSNDSFSVISAYTIEQELRIYNRWGEVIFVSTDENPEWDGTYRGEPVQPMVYPYVVTYRSQYFPDRPAVVKRGSLLLLR